MFLLIALLSSLPAHAVDTSGCGQLITKRQDISRPNGAVLSGIYEGPNSASCWNADRAKLTVAYSFPSKVVLPAISFWTSLNGVEKSVKPAVLECRADVIYRTNNEAPKTCRGCGEVVVGELENGASLTCTATLVFRNGAGPQSLEIAPVVNGEFDTDGFGKNLRISF